VSRTKRIQALRELARDVERLCNAAGARRLLSELKDEAATQERRHRAMGRRVCDARYSASVRDAVCYFVCETVLEAMPVPKDWQSFCAIRRDHQLGQACRERILEHGSGIGELAARWIVLALDYSTDIAGNR
jgi:hypothetical protein